MQQWLVAGGLIEQDQTLCLVRNRRRSGAVDWSPPGGVIDPGETVVEGLTREVREETGLVVLSWEGPVYEIRAEAPDLGWTLRVEVHRATGYEGELGPVVDPDGIVDEARWVAVDSCEAHLAAGHPWVREPLTEWLRERFSSPRTFEYRVAGSDPTELVVMRR